jgi:hypothetical protein
MPTLAQVDFGNRVENAVATFIDVLPKALLFILILVVGMIVAKAIAKLLDSLLEKVGFDKWVERGGVKSALERTPYDASDFLSKLVYYALVLFTLQLAFGVFGDNPISDLLRGLIAYLPNIFVAVLIIVVAAFVASMVRDVVGAATSSAEYGSLITMVAYWAILVVGVFAALDQLQIAPMIVTGLFYALLAIVAGSAIIAIGGGGIQPMRSRWESFLTKAAEESRAVKYDSDAAELAPTLTQRSAPDSDPSPTAPQPATPRPDQPSSPTPPPETPPATTPHPTQPGAPAPPQEMPPTSR